jgi:uroporphyrinogen-III synthase
MKFLDLFLRFVLTQLCLTFLICTSFHCQTNLHLLKQRNFPVFSFPKVALTRETEANQKLRHLLSPDVDCVDIPCIAYDIGPDYDKLASSLSDNDVVLLTSPQSSHVFLNVLKSISSSSSSLMPSATLFQPTQIISIGKGTSGPLLENGIKPIFEPSDSHASSLVKEWPDSLLTSKRILYPCSTLADNKFVDLLAAKGYEVMLVCFLLAFFLIAFFLPFL